MIDNVTVMTRIHEMLSKSHTKIIEESERLLKSGGVNLESYDDDYLLPKIILYVALKNQAEQWKPFDKNALKDAKNLEHF